MPNYGSEEIVRALPLPLHNIGDRLCMTGNCAVSRSFRWIRLTTPNTRPYGQSIELSSFYSTQQHEILGSNGCRNEILRRPET